MSRHLPGLTWRILAHRKREDGMGYPAIDLSFGPKDGVEFDELVLGDDCALHIEQMDNREWCILIYTPTESDPHARWNGNLHIPVKGPARLTWTESPDMDERELRMSRLESALEMIAAPERPDGSGFNRDREACRQLAVEALKRDRDAR